MPRQAPNNRLPVSGNAGDPFPDNQRVNVIGALVGLDCFEVRHVAHDGVLGHDAVGTRPESRSEFMRVSHPDVDL